MMGRELWLWFSRCGRGPEGAMAERETSAIARAAFSVIMSSVKPSFEMATPSTSSI